MTNRLANGKRLVQKEPKFSPSALPDVDLSDVFPLEGAKGTEI
jgi:hypothetical protein